MIPAGLLDKRVLITAAGSGIGRAMAEAFLRQGAKVAVCDIDAGSLDALASEAPEITAVAADVADEADVAALFKTVRDKLGGLDVLVNNAGIAGPAGYLEDLSAAEWRRCLSVNVDGGFLCARQALPLMKAQGLGCIINMASNAGILGFPMRSPYAASKWAVVGLTKSLAMEAGVFGIRVNAIAPGSVEGERLDRVIKAEADARGVTPDQIREDYYRTSSLRTFVSADEVASMTLFLASDASAKISGQVIPLDGHTETLGGPY